jgi:hypothetical protein
LLAAVDGATNVMRLLAANGADVRANTKYTGTLLITAAGLGRVPGEVLVPESDTLAAARLAVEFGADVNAVDAVGNHALHYAAFLRRDSIIQFLADQGATLDVKNKYGETPLWAAELILQFAGGGTYQSRRSSTGDLLRRLGARTIDPSYGHARPAVWPGIPQSRGEEGTPRPPETPERPGDRPPAGR